MIDLAFVCTCDNLIALNPFKIIVEICLKIKTLMLYEMHANLLSNVNAKPKTQTMNC